MSNPLYCIGRVQLARRLLRCLQCHRPQRQRESTPSSLGGANFLATLRSSIPTLRAIQAGGGKILVRGTPAKTFENGLNDRIVVVEFASVAAAIATYESDAYKAALKVLGNAADRDLRIVEGVE